MWNTNKQNAIQELIKIYNEIEKNRAYNSFDAAKNTWLLSSLYLSKIANKLCEILFQKLASYMVSYSGPRKLNHRKGTVKLHYEHEKTLHRII